MRGIGSVIYDQGVEVGRAICIESFQLSVNDDSAGDAGAEAQVNEPAFRRFAGRILSPGRGFGVRKQRGGQPGSPTELVDQGEPFELRKVD